MKTCKMTGKPEVCPKLRDKGKKKRSHEGKKKEKATKWIASFRWKESLGSCSVSVGRLMGQFNSLNTDGVLSMFSTLC